MTAQPMTKQANRGTTPTSTSRWLFDAAAGVRSRLLGAIVLGALASGCGVALMATSAWLIARAAQHPPVLYLMVAVVAVRTFGLGRGALRYAERLVSHDAAFRLLSHLRQALMAHLADIAPGRLQLWRRGDLLTRLVTDVDDVGNAYLRGLLPLAVALVVGGGTVALAAAILPAAGLALAVALLLTCLLGPVAAARRGARTESAVVALRARRDALLSDLLDDLTDLTLGDLLAVRMQELTDVESALQRSAARSARTAGITAGGAVLAMGVAVLSAIFWGVPAVTGGHLTAVLLAVLVLTPLALADTVQAVGAAAAALQRSSAAADRLALILLTAPLSTPPAHPRPLPRTATGPVVELHGVSARWPGSDQDALHEIDLRLVPGQRVVVLGESGSGKSTLLAVLLGFLPPSAGRITVDGIDLAELDPDAARTLFAWCDQQAHLFDSTLAENVRLARPEATDTQIGTALAAAGAAQWLGGLPRGLATQVGEHGAAVSGGQRQRIAVARALLADRPILLADEPAAHLDAATAAEVTHVIMQADPGRCAVLVTHNEADALGADVVVRLAHGRIRRSRCCCSGREQLDGQCLHRACVVHSRPAPSTGSFLAAGHEGDRDDSVVQ